MTLDPNVYASLAAAYLGGIRAPVPGEQGYVALVDANGTNLEYSPTIPAASVSGLDALGTRWRVIQETDWTAEPETNFDVDGEYTLSDGSIWYKENPAAETYPPKTLSGGQGLRWIPNNTGGLPGRAAGLLSSRNSDLAALPATTPLRMSVLMAGANNPGGNALQLYWGLEVSPPGGSPPQQHCIYGRWGAAEGVAYPGSAEDWYFGNVYNNIGETIGSKDTAAALRALKCYRITLGHGVLPWHVLIECAADAAGDWPAESDWNVRGFGADWSSYLAYAQGYTDIATRGTFGAWGQVLTAYRGFTANVAAYVVVAKTRLEAYY